LYGNETTIYALISRTSSSALMEQTECEPVTDRQMRAIPNRVLQGLPGSFRQRRRRYPFSPLIAGLLQRPAWPRIDLSTAAADTL
jgi:hypothetical protein